MMPTKIQPRHMLPALALLATAVAPGSAAASCAGARANLAFIQQKIGAIRVEARAAGASEVPEGTRQELARWAAVLPRAELEVAQQCAAAAPPAQQQTVIGPPGGPRNQAQPPLIATPVMTPPPGSQPMRATPAQTVARPTAPPAVAPPATVAVRVPGATADPRAGERSVRSKLNPAQDVAAGALTTSAAHPHTVTGTASNQSHIQVESHVMPKQTSLRQTTGTAVRTRKRDLAGTVPRQSFARPIFKTKN